MSRNKLTMNRRKWMMLSGAAVAMRPGAAPAQPAEVASQAGAEDVPPEKLLLKDYYPKSVFKIPITEIKKAKFPIIDVHYHARVKSPEDVDAMVKMMDATGVERTIAFCGTGAGFDSFHRLYSRYPKRFDVWCGLDVTGIFEPGYGPAAVKELERCHRVGAVGVGEVTDKGMGIGGIIGRPINWAGAGPASGMSLPDGRPSRKGLHPDEPGMDPIWQKCADLGMLSSLLASA